MAGTVGVADIYGRASVVGGAFDPLSPQNANGGAVAPITEQASGAVAATGTGSGPALSLLGLVLALVLLRIALHAASRA